LIVAEKNATKNILDGRTEVKQYKNMFKKIKKNYYNNSLMDVRQLLLGSVIHQLFLIFGLQE
jgi:hypothetical protein